jgi:energy-coupling factor transporter transmembrane protein EcfT
MEIEAGKGLIAAAFLIVLAILAPLEYAPLSFILLLGWAAFNRTPLARALAASALFSISIGVSAIILGMDLVHGLLTSLRAVSLVLPAYVFFSGYKLHELDETLRSFGVPEDFSFMLSLSSTYSGVMGRKAQSVRVAQECRGSKSPWALIMPMLNFVFERAKMLAISLECRGWSPSNK